MRKCRTRVEDRSAHEGWVDAAKGMACFLVVLGHGVQGLLLAGVWPSQRFFWCAVQALHCFHVQLFFICSGYLWQRYGRSGGWRGHAQAVLGKAWRLGVPYMVFATFSWLLKTVCGHSVNYPAGTLAHDLFVVPAAPYWFLPALSLLFALLPRVKSKGEWALAFALAVAAKTAAVAWNNANWFFPVRTVALHAFWFASGMGLALYGTDRLRGRAARRSGVACAVLFLTGSAIATRDGWWWHPQYWRVKALLWGVGAVACVAVLSWAVPRHKGGFWEWLGRRTLPIFLMHTIFAAAMRIGLVALGVRALWIHVPAMLTASIVAPLAVMRVMEWVRLDGLVDPRQWYVRRKGSSAGWIGLSNGVGRL